MIPDLAREFPGLVEPDGRPFHYLDSAATAQKHRRVIERMDAFLRHDYGTVHRSLYRRSAAATQAYEEARATVARFFNAPGPDNAVFTMGCTDAINLVAWAWGRAHLRPGDQVLVSAMEHHAGIVPWQIVGGITGAELAVCPMHDDGSLDLAVFERLLAGGRVKIVNLVHVANSLGTVNPVADCVRLAHRHGARILIDAAQSAPHRRLDVQALGCDFLVCAPHKMYGPTGIGVLIGTAEALESMPPWRGGGEMIEQVTFERTTFATPPLRFEAGTPPIVEAVGLAEACRVIDDLGWDSIGAHERALFAHAEAVLAEVPGLRRIGTAPERSSVLSFVIDGTHPADLAAVLDGEGVAIRAGHHCAQPVMRRFGVPATARISLGVYTTPADLDAAGAALKKAARLLR